MHLAVLFKSKCSRAQYALQYVTLHKWDIGGFAGCSSFVEDKHLNNSGAHSGALTLGTLCNEPLVLSDCSVGKKNIQALLYKCARAAQGRVHGMFAGRLAVKGEVNLTGNTLFGVLTAVFWYDGPHIQVVPRVCKCSVLSCPRRILNYLTLGKLLQI